jgi:phospholipase/carboxylesterase
VDSEHGPGFDWGNELDHLAVQDYFLKAVEQTRRSFHIHSERIYLVGLGSGCVPAYRTALAMPERMAGVIALNGPFPQPNGEPLFQMDRVRGLKSLICHGLTNQETPIRRARHAQQVLWTAGAEVEFRTYMTNHRVHPDMLRDVNRWIVSNLNAETDRLILKKKKAKKRKKF